MRPNLNAAESENGCLAATAGSGAMDLPHAAKPGRSVQSDPGDAEPNLPAGKSASERVVWPITRGCRQGFRNADKGLRGSGLRYSVTGKGRWNSRVDLAYNTLR
jgi:hypothetical protein